MTIDAAFRHAQDREQPMLRWGAYYSMFCLYLTAELLRDFLWRQKVH